MHVRSRGPQVDSACKHASTRVRMQALLVPYETPVLSLYVIRPQKQRCTE